MGSKCQKLTKESFALLLSHIDTVLFDADGVLWHGNRPIPGAPESVSFFKNQGKRVFLVTNNSSHSRREYVTKCNHLKYDFEEDHLITSSAVLADHLEREKFRGKVYVAGMNGIKEELDTVGIDNFGSGSDNLDHYSSKHDLYNLKFDPEVKAVTVGYDVHFSYVKMLKAASYLHNPQCQFIATNDDSTFPGPNIPLPGAGSIVAAIKEASGREPLVLGKPHKPLVDYIRRKHGLDAEKTLMVGDRCDTDIRFANNNGFHSLLVLTGVTRIDQLATLSQENMPTYYTEALSDILNL